MPDILQDIDVEVSCAQCGESYRFPAAFVATSQRLLDDGCPGTSSHECAAAFYAELIEPMALTALVRAWEKVQRSARAHGERALFRERPHVDITLPVANVREVDPLARWEDDGGRTAASSRRAVSHEGSAARH